MNNKISDDTYVALLLTAPLIKGRGNNNEKVKLISPSEFGLLVQLMDKLDIAPSSLLTKEGLDLFLDNLDARWDKERIEALLDRAFSLSICIEYWGNHGFFILSPFDSRYPGRIKELNKHAPPVLYCCGPVQLLEGGGLSVVGSRSIDDEMIKFTQEVGTRCASEDLALVSGGARGVDQISMSSCLDHGGKVIGVLADRLSMAALSSENRAYLDKDLLLISPFDPDVGFNAGNAMSRNKLIYTMSDYGLVVNSDLEKGGTWSGATELLKSNLNIPLFVRDGGEKNKGNARLIEMGGIPWPDDLKDTPLTSQLADLSEKRPNKKDSSKQLDLDL